MCCWLPQRAFSSPRVVYARQQLIELALPVELIEIVASTDMMLPDPDLRNGAATAGLFCHFSPHIRPAGDVDFLESDPLSLQELLRHEAIRAEDRCVNRNF